MTRAHVLVSSGGPLGHHLVAYHRAMLERASAALDHVPRDEREISSVTLCVSQAKLLELEQQIRDGALTHNPWPSLDLAAATAVPKMTEGGAFLWDGRRSPNDVAPLRAATGAVWLLNRPVEAPTVSAYEDHDLIVI